MGAAPRRGSPAGNPGSLDLRALDPPPGGAGRRELPVAAPTLALGGQRYRVEPSEPVVALDVIRTLGGRHLRLRAAATLAGPCWRCLEDARVPVAVDTTELSTFDRPPDAPFDDDLDSVYVERDRLDLTGWLRDALVDALPDAILCDPDCAGLCPRCGARRAEGPCGCVEPAGDPRWAALGPLAERLRREG